MSNLDFVPLQERLSPIETIGIDTANTWEFTVPGKPLPLKQSVFVGHLGRSLNPHRRNVLHFQAKICEYLPPHVKPPYVPGLGKAVHLVITFRIPRPIAHFVEFSHENGKVNFVFKII